MSNLIGIPYLRPKGWAFNCRVQGDQRRYYIKSAHESFYLSNIFCSVYWFETFIAIQIVLSAGDIKYTKSNNRNYAVLWHGHWHMPVKAYSPFSIGAHFYNLPNCYICDVI